jgi:corrinoid protein of di/trimethylamine methyltransferase
MSEPQTDLSRLREAILTGDANTAKEVTEAALKEGANPQSLVMDYMVPAMDEVGNRFECNEYFVPELLIAARAMKTSLELIRPLLSEQGIEPIGRVVIGTVKGDLHDIGKGLVASMLEGGGFEVTDLGVDVPADRFVQAVQETNAHIIALSALLTTTMTAMKGVIEALDSAGVRDKVKVIIGGAPVTQQYCESITADGYSATASGAVNLARQFV